MLIDDEIDVDLCISPAFYLCLCLTCLYAFLPKFMKVRSLLQGQNAAKVRNVVFSTLEIRLRES